MRFSLLLVLPALAAALPAANNNDITSALVPDPTKVHIQSVTYGGTGCPQGSVGNSTSADKTTMTLIFDQYVASIGPGIAVTESRKNCQLNIDLFYPPGFQFSIFSADYRGYIGLQQGVTGLQKSTYYFSGQTNQASTQTSFTGPVNKDYLLHDEVQSASTVWSPCGAEGMLNINSQVRLTSTIASATGLFTTDSIDGKFTQILYFNWQTCKS